MVNADLTKYKGKRVLITGGGGFIGGFVIKALSELGATIHITGTRSRRQENYHSCNITDPVRCREVVRSVQPHYVIHLAASTNRSTEIEKLSDVMKVNFIGTQNILEACRQEGTGTIESVVSLGSSEEYGVGSDPHKETDRELPQSPYGLSKLCATRLTQIYGKKSTFRTTTLRPFIVYGPGQKSNMLIPQIISSQKKGLSVDVTTGLQTRDFVYVEDVAEAILLAGLDESTTGEIYNVASGEPVTVRNVVEELVRISDNKIKINFGAKEMRSDECMLNYGDIAKIKAVLGWVPRTSLKEGLEKTFRGFI